MTENAKKINLLCAAMGRTAKRHRFLVRMALAEMKRKLAKESARHTARCKPVKKDPMDQDYVWNNDHTKLIPVLGENESYAWNEDRTAMIVVGPPNPYEDYYHRKRMAVIADKYTGTIRAIRAKTWKRIDNYLVDHDLSRTDIPLQCLAFFRTENENLANVKFPA
jgi:hypothetical protein